MNFTVTTTINPAYFWSVFFHGILIGMLALAPLLTVFILERKQYLKKDDAPASSDVFVTLPDGRQLVASDKQDGEYPGIRIEVIDKNQVHGIAWVEYNTGRADYAPNQRLRLIFWKNGKDEPIINVACDTGESEQEKT